MKWIFPVGDERIEIDLSAESAHEWTQIRPGDYLLRVGTRTFTIDSIRVADDQVHFRFDSVPYSLPYLDEQAAMLEKLGFRKTASASKGDLKAPMPGRIISVHVNVGDVVSSGQRLIVLEAMKMENELRSIVDGTVSAIHAQPGQSVEKNIVLIEVQPLG
jgi:pyruvate carboxylase subunit B